MPVGTEVGLGPGDIVLDGVAAPPKRGTAPPKGTQPPNFRPMSIVAKRSPISATAELLSNLSPNETDFSSLTSLKFSLTPKQLLRHCKVYFGLLVSCRFCVDLQVQ